MPYRALPNSDSARLSALEACATKATTVAATARPYSDELQSRLEALLGKFRTEARETGTALSAQTAATARASLDFAALQTNVSHFIQVLNLAIARGVIPAEARGHYGLDVSSTVVPAISSHSAAVLWAQRIIAGEAARRAADPAAPAMALPSAAEVAATLTAYDASSKAQSTAKDTLDREQEDVDALRPTIDALITDLWDTIEFAYRKDSAPSRRRKCREWGIVYITRPGEELDPEEATPAPPTTPPTA